MDECREFKILSKIKALVGYSNTYILNTIPRSEISIKINYENNLYKLLEESSRADVNKGNIRSKSIKEMIVYCRMIDFYLGLLYDKKIITKARFITVAGILNEVAKMSHGWLNYEEKNKNI